MSTFDQDLRHQMIIDKARRPNTKITVKSLVTLGITWMLWLYALYYLTNRYHILLDRTFILDWTFKDILIGVVVILLVQLNVLLLWSIFVRSRMKKQREAVDNWDK